MSTRNRRTPASFMALVCFLLACASACSRADEGRGTTTPKAFIGPSGVEDFVCRVIAESNSIKAEEFMGTGLTVSGTVGEIAKVYAGNQIGMLPDARGTYYRVTLLTDSWIASGGLRYRVYFFCFFTESHKEWLSRQSAGDVMTVQGRYNFWQSAAGVVVFHLQGCDGISFPQ